MRRGAARVRMLHACVAPVLLLALAACERQADVSKTGASVAGNTAAGDPAAGDPAAADAIAGKAVFQTCASCHQLGPSARGGFGPQLNGIIGRTAGTTPDYRYSPAMKNAGFAWSEDKLRAFLKDPDQVVPGNKMRFFGLRSERDIDKLLAYLRMFQQAPAAAPRTVQSALSFQPSIPP